MEETLWCRHCRHSVAGAIGSLVTPGKLPGQIFGPRLEQDGCMSQDAEIASPYNMYTLL